MTDPRDNQSASAESSFSAEPPERAALTDGPEEYSEPLHEDEELQIELVSGEEDETHAASLPSRLARLLIPLLVLIAATAGYLLLASETPDSSPPVGQTAKQPIALPQLPSAPVDGTLSPAGTLPGAVQPLPATPAAGHEGSPEPTAAMTIPATAAAPVLPAVPPAGTAPAVNKPAPMPAQPPGDYSVQVGAFRQLESLQAARRLADRTGFPLRVEETRQMTSMTRLLYGRFPAEVANHKLAELPALAAAAAFQVAGDELTSIYVGSFSRLDKARAYAQVLAKQGLVVEEEAVEVPVPLFKLKLGPFHGREAAEQAAVVARASGLSAQVLRKPVP